jgi:hypothetical protein
MFALISALYNDQCSNPHRIPTEYPLRNMMLTAQRFDKSGRTRSEYESLSASIEKWARRPDAVCDECSHFADPDWRQVFTLRQTFISYTLCSNCDECWMAEGDAGLPRITGLRSRYKHAERWENEDKHKLPSLPPSGALFAGLVIPGGSEPISVPLRAGDRALPNVSRILNTFRFEEAA